MRRNKSNSLSLRQVNTVLGPIPSNSLGVTLMHEHIIFGYAGWYADETIAPFQKKRIMEAALPVLLDIKNAGIDTIVDATTNDSGGRDGKCLKVLKELARKSRLNIILATGLTYDQHGASAYWKTRQEMLNRNIKEEISQLFIAEIMHGIKNSGIKAGVIKVGTSQGQITPYEEVVLKAAARAQSETGVPIITHTEGPTMGPQQADILIGAGANPKQIMIGHMNNSEDTSYHLSILERPDVSLGFDRTGMGLLPSHNKIVSIISELCRKGFNSRICLSHDYIVAMLGRPSPWPEPIKPLLADFYPTFIIQKLIPALMEAGITREQIDEIMIRNPQRLFEGA